MKIGIDARLLSLPVTGIGRYTHEMCRQLVMLEGQYCLYTPAPPMQDDWQQTHVSVRHAACSSRVSRMLWSQTLLPLWAAQDKVDLFWGTSHRLPRFLPAATARVVTIHDMVWKIAGETMRPLSRFMEGALMPQAIHMADRVIADSLSTAEAIESAYPAARGKVRVVYLGATILPAPAAFSSLACFEIDRPYFLFVGTLEPRKNLKRLVEAYAGLDEEVRNQTLLVIAGGKGWGAVDLAALVEKLGVTRHVRLTGYVSESELATLYAHARFLAMPSVYEGFGLPLVEAMSLGVPVLTSNVSSLPEVAGDAAVLVDPLVTASIAHGLSSLLTDQQLHDRLAGLACANAARFSWQKAAGELHGIFVEACNERKKRKR